MKIKPIDRYLEIISDRPVKMDAKEVDYTLAPEGSVLRCNNCVHFFRRSIDGFSVCEIFRSEESDREGVNPAGRCKFFTSDTQVFPLLPEEESQPDEEEVLARKPRGALRGKELDAAIAWRSARDTARRDRRQHTGEPFGPHRLARAVSRSGRHAVHRFNQRPARQQRPHAIDGGAGVIRVLRAGDPRGQLLTPRTLGG